MRILLLCFLMIPVVGWAQISTIEISLQHSGKPNRPGRFRIILDEANPAHDQLQRLSPQGHWECIFQGPITRVDLPLDSRIESAVLLGARSRAAGLLRQGRYDLSKPLAGGLRLRSNSRLVVVTEHGAAVLPWPDEVVDFRELDSDADSLSGVTISIIAVKGKTLQGTYLYLNDDFSNPHRLRIHFTKMLLGARLVEGKIEIRSLARVLDPVRMTETLQKRAEFLAGNKAQTRPKLEVKFRAGEVMDELIDQLDEREPMASAINAKEQVELAVREVLLREFPVLQTLEQGDAQVRDTLARVVRALANLWLSGRISDGATIKRIIEGRLEALPVAGQRSECELALLKLSGPGSHSLSYERGAALRGLNFLYRRMYRAN